MGALTEEVELEAEEDLVLEDVEEGVEVDDADEVVEVKVELGVELVVLLEVGPKMSVRMP